jgi:cytochrome c-type biogenesis protein CcmF
MSMNGEGYVAAIGGLLRKNQRRYGGYVVHVGVVAIFLGVTMSSVYRVEEIHTVKQGEQFTVGPYTLRFDDARSEEDDHLAKVIAKVTAFEGDREIAVLEPEKRFYKRPQQPATEVAMRSTMKDDLYIVLGSYDQGSATLQVYVNPLVWWLWFGGAVLVLGTAIAAWPTGSSRRREEARLQRGARA